MGVCLRQGVARHLVSSQLNSIPQADRGGWNNNVKSIPPGFVALSRRFPPFSSDTRIPLDTWWGGIFGAATGKIIEIFISSVGFASSISMSGRALNAIKLISQQMPSNRRALDFDFISLLAIVGGFVTFPLESSGFLPRSSPSPCPLTDCFVQLLLHFECESVAVVKVVFILLLSLHRLQMRSMVGDPLLASPTKPISAIMGHHRCVCS